MCVTLTINNALEVARRIGGLSNGMQALVTRSLHLVGGVLRLLELNLHSRMFDDIILSTVGDI